MKGVPRQSFLPACCLIGKCNRNFAAFNCRVSARELVDVRRPATRCLTQLVHTLHKSSRFLRQHSHRFPGFSPSLAVIVGVRRQCEQLLIASKAASTGTAYRWRSSACPRRKVPTGHRRSPPCHGSRGRVSRPYGRRAEGTPVG